MKSIESQKGRFFPRPSFMTIESVFEQKKREREVISNSAIVGVVLLLLVLVIEAVLIFTNIGRISDQSGTLPQSSLLERSEEDISG
jgi:hypothetical protein